MTRLNLGNPGWRRFKNIPPQPTILICLSIWAHCIGDVMQKNEEDKNTIDIKIRREFYKYYKVISIEPLRS